MLYAGMSRVDITPPQGLELTRVYYPEAAFIMPEDIKWHTD